MMTNPKRIDLHTHVFPPALVAELGRRNIEWTGGAGVPKWSVDMALELMDRQGIDAVVASIQPQVYWGDTVAAAVSARASNEHLARVIQDHPHKFGGFASLPLPDIDAALREIEYAFDVLK